MEVVASLSQGRTAAVQCGLLTYKSVLVIFEPPCIISPVVKLMVVLVVCRLCIYLVLMYIWNMEYFHLPTTNYNTESKNLLESGKVLNLPNDFLHGSFL